MNISRHINFIATIISIFIIGGAVGYFWGGVGEVEKEKGASITIEEYQNQFEEYKEKLQNTADRKMMIMICIIVASLFLIVHAALKKMIVKLFLCKVNQSKV